MMDTLGTITPQTTDTTETAHRIEALERLRYLAHSGTCGLVSGVSGSGKSECLNELARRLRREGMSVAQINLTAVSAPELPWLMSSRLGAGLSIASSAIDCWMWLQEYAEASRSSRRQLAVLVDQIDRSEDAVIAPLRRMVDAFGSSCAWIFATGESLSPAWHTFLNEQVWLRVELQNLTRRESQQLLSRDLLQRGSSARFTPDGIEAVQELAQGHVRQLQHIAELAALASEADGITQFDADMVRSLTSEFLALHR